MNMTHYMELLAHNQPWNLIIFMAIPVGLAETVVITELYLLFTRRMGGWVRQLNRWAGIAVGLYFVGIIVWLMKTAVLPITAAGQWRTALDVTAVAAYLLGGIPLVLVALQELGLIHRHCTPEQKLGRHAAYVAAFLILGHVAMIVGMADPALLGYQGPDAHAMPMDHGAMNHSEHGGH
jgi:hypothetical protein